MVVEAHVPCMMPPKAIMKNQHVFRPDVFSVSFTVPHAEAENLEMSTLQVSKEITQDKSIKHLIHNHQHGKGKRERKIQPTHRNIENLEMSENPDASTRQYRQGKLSFIIFFNQ